MIIEAHYFGIYWGHFCVGMLLLIRKIKSFIYYISNIFPDDLRTDEVGEEVFSLRVGRFGKYWQNLANSILFFKVVKKVLDQFELISWVFSPKFS